MIERQALDADIRSLDNSCLSFLFSSFILFNLRCSILMGTSPSVIVII